MYTPGPVVTAASTQITPKDGMPQLSVHACLLSIGAEVGTQDNVTVSPLAHLRCKQAASHTTWIGPIA
eukprot:5427236-Amphidinium_carterae.2